MFQIKAISKDVRKTIVPSFMFLIIVIVNKYTAKSRQPYHLIFNILLHVSNHALKDMYILNYGTFLKSFFYSSIQVLIDFINSVIAIHVFFKVIPFFTSASNTSNRMNVQSESCLVVAYSIHFHPQLINFSQLVD